FSDIDTSVGLSSVSDIISSARLSRVSDTLSRLGFLDFPRSVRLFRSSDISSRS
ncbi:hypothetical protein KI387_017083, partial [Taxus chinensis]